MNQSVCNMVATGLQQGLCTEMERENRMHSGDYGTIFAS